MTVQGHLARPPRRICRQSFPEEGLRRGNTSIRAQQEVHGLALLVRCAVQVVQFSPNTKVGVSRPVHCSPSPSQNRTGTCGVRIRKSYREAVSELCGEFQIFATNKTAAPRLSPAGSRDETRYESRITPAALTSYGKSRGNLNDDVFVARQIAHLAGHLRLHRAPGYFPGGLLATV